MRRATVVRRPTVTGQAISIHALLAESDAQRQSAQRQPDGFLSTLSLRRATCRRPEYRTRPGNFYPRSPCGERRHDWAGRVGQADFYPRSPCGERPPCSRSEKQKRLISIHALLAESDLPLGACLDNKQTFLSTLSLRRATEPPGPCRCGRPHFYPRSPCGERPINQWYSANLAQISIHALLAESDQFLTGGPSHDFHFYPRSPCGERP